MSNGEALVWFAPDALGKFINDAVVPFGWPVVAVVALLMFKRQLRDVLERLIKAGPQGFEWSSQTTGAATVTPNAISDAGIKQLKDNAESGLKPWITMIEQQVKADPNLGSADELLRLAAILNRRAHGEYILRLIFGSQLKAMERMTDEPKSAPELRDLYEQHVRDASIHALPTFEAWMSFLLGTNLVKIENGHYHLTEFGMSFFDLLLQSGFSTTSKAW